MPVANAIRCNPGNEANKQIHLPPPQSHSGRGITKNRQTINKPRRTHFRIFIPPKGAIGESPRTQKNTHLVSLTPHSRAPRVSETSLVILKNLNTHEIKYPPQTAGGSRGIECSRKMFFHDSRSGIARRVPGVSKIGSRPEL